MFEIFKKRFKVGDKVKLIRTGQKAVIVDKGTLPIAKKASRRSFSSLKTAARRFRCCRRILSELLDGNRTRVSRLRIQGQSLAPKRQTK